MPDDSKTGHLLDHLCSYFLVFLFFIFFFNILFSLIATILIGQIQYRLLIFPIFFQNVNFLLFFFSLFSNSSDKWSNPTREKKCKMVLIKWSNFSFFFSAFSFIILSSLHPYWSYSKPCYSPFPVF